MAAGGCAWGRENQKHFGAPCPVWTEGESGLVPALSLHSPPWDRFCAHLDLRHHAPEHRSAWPGEHAGRASVGPEA